MITLTYNNNNRYLLKIGNYNYHLSEKEVIKLNKQSEKLLNGDKNEKKQIAKPAVSVNAVAKKKIKKN